MSRFICYNTIQYDTKTYNAPCYKNVIRRRIGAYVVLAYTFLVDSAVCWPMRLKGVVPIQSWCSSRSRIWCRLRTTNEFFTYAACSVEPTF